VRDRQRDARRAGNRHANDAGQGDLNQTRYGSTATTRASCSTRRQSRMLRVHDPRLQRGGGEPEPGHPSVRRVSRHLNEVADLEPIEIPIVPRTLEPLASGSTRLFSGVATYADGEPATADSDEFIRQYYEGRDHRLAVAEKYAFHEYGWNKTPTRS